MDLRIIYKYDGELIAIGEHPMCGNTIPALLKLYDILSESRIYFKPETLDDLIEVYVTTPFENVDIDLIEQLNNGYGDIARCILKEKTVIKNAGKLLKPTTSEFLCSGYTYITVDLHSSTIDISGILSKVPVDLMKTVRISLFLYDIGEEFHGPIFKFDELGTYIKILDDIGRKVFKYNDEVMTTYSIF